MPIRFWINLRYAAGLHPTSAEEFVMMTSPARQYKDGKLWLCQDWVSVYICVQWFVSVLSSMLKKQRRYIRVMLPETPSPYRIICFTSLGLLSHLQRLEFEFWACQMLLHVGAVKIHVRSLWAQQSQRRLMSWLHYFCKHLTHCTLLASLNGTFKTRFSMEASLEIDHPKVMLEWPPGGAMTREEVLSVTKLPTFWPSERW
jgi:hypothetical protein